MPSDELLQAIEDLIKSGSADDEPAQFKTPTFQAVDVYPIFQNYFNKKAQLALSVKTDSLIYQRNRDIRILSLLSKLGAKSCEKFNDSTFIRVFDVVRFCASTADKQHIHKAVEKVINTINILANKNYITATLLPLSVLPIMTLGEVEPQYAVFSYVAITSQGDLFISSNNLSNMFVSESEMPKSYLDQ